jgi:hypothetical protein
LFRPEHYLFAAGRGLGPRRSLTPTLLLLLLLLLPALGLLPFRLARRGVGHR